MKRLGLRVITTCLLIGLAGCTSSAGSGQITADRPVAKPIDFNEPTTPQAAEKAHSVGDRTEQALQAVAARGGRIVAVGFDESANVSRALFISSDDAGRTWTRRQLDKDSLERSQTFEGATDIAGGTLRASNATSLGNTTGNTTIESGATSPRSAASLRAT